MADGLCMEGTAVRTTNNVISNKDELNNAFVVVANENINKSIDNKLSVDVKCNVNSSDSSGVDEEEASSSPCESSSSSSSSVLIVNNNNHNNNNNSSSSNSSSSSSSKSPHHPPASSSSSSNFYIDSDSGKLCSSKFNNNDASSSVGNNVGVVVNTSNSSSSNNNENGASPARSERMPQATVADVGDKTSTSAPIVSAADGANQEEVVVVQCSDPHSPCSSADHEDCRKKRCADRYDSSESSDSGVAQLSCTDCSACSSSSTASSDITDPGSPFSTTSSHGEDSSPAPTSSTAGGIQTMPPRQDTATSCWPTSDPSTTKQLWPWNKTEKHVSSAASETTSKIAPKDNIPNKSTAYAARTAAQSLKRAPSTKSAHSKVSPKRLKAVADEKIPPTSSQISFLTVAQVQNVKPAAIPHLAPIISSVHPPILLESKPHDTTATAVVYKTPARLLKSPPSLVKTPTIPCHILPKSQSSGDTIAVANTNLIQANAALKNRSGDKLLPKDIAKNNNTLTCKARTLSHLAAQNLQKNQQGKITEYFKEQIKTPVCVKKELNGSGTAIQSNSETKKKKGHYLGLVSGNTMGRKLIVNGKCDSVRSADFYRKIDVRPVTTTTMPTQLKKATDSKINKRMSPVVSLTRKILPKPPTDQHKTGPQTATAQLNPSVKLTALRFSHDMNAVAANVSAQPIENVLVSNANAFHGAVKLVNAVPVQKRTTPLIIPTSLNTALPTVMTPKVNSMQVLASSYTNCPPLVKLNGTFIPIVKLNSLPVKLNGASVRPHQLPASIPNSISTSPTSIDTGIPTVPIIKPKTVVAPASDACLKVSTAATAAQTKPLGSPKSALLETIQQKKAKLDVKHGDGAQQKTMIVKDDERKDKSTTVTDVVVEGKHVHDLLQVSVVQSPMQAIESQKSPILSQPKTIRFPPREINNDDKEHRRSESRDSGLCRWSECKAQFETSGALLEHLQIAHVISQATKENYVCLWVGCKVHGRTSCSRSWLERHVLSHAGNKPYRCIVDGCGCRFNSQTALERHVNSHFNSAEGTPTNGARKSLESSASKLLKRNGKKIRYRLQPWSARMFDFFDAGIMEGLQQKLVNVTRRRTSGRLAECSGKTMSLRSRILARRTAHDKTVQVLLRWYPEDVVPDEWVPESEAKPVKDVPIPGLEPSAIDALHTTLIKKDLFGCAAPTPSGSERRKNKRKTSSGAPGAAPT